MGYYSSAKVNIGNFSLKSYIVKKYGQTIFTPFDGVKEYGGYIFTYEQGPREVGMSTKPGQGYALPSLQIEDIVWARRAGVSENTPQLIVYATTKNTVRSWNRQYVFNGNIPGNTIKHPIALSIAGGREVKYDNYDSYMINFCQNLKFYPQLNELVRQFKASEKKREAKYFKENGIITPAQKKAYKAEIKKNLLAESNKIKLEQHLVKEMDMVTQLSVSMSSLIDECMEMQKYLANPDNRLNVGHYKSRVKKVKEVIKVIQRMKPKEG